MSVLIIEDIKDILFEKKEVTIPAIGTFVGTYKSASIDGVSGQIAPPALDVVFDNNALVNDGILFDFVQKKYSLSAYESDVAIETFAKEIKATFDKNEIVIIPQIGRLYRDFAQKIQFLPDKTNFNTDSFALPTVQFYPVSRTKAEVQSVVEKGESSVAPSQPLAALSPTMDAIQPPISPLVTFPESAENISAPAMIAVDEKPSFWEANRQAVLYASALCMVGLLAVVVYLTNEKSAPKDVYTEGVNSDKVNVSPAKPEPNEAVTSIVTPPPTATQPVQNQRDTQQVSSDKFFKEDKKKGANNTQMSENNAAVSPSVGSNKSTIIIGGFANKSNIKRLKTWITENGYGVYEKKTGSLTVVGAEVSFENSQDLEVILKRIRARYGEEVEVLIRN